MAMTQMMKKLYRISRERSVFPHMSSFMHTSPDSCPAAIISHLLYHAPGLLQITEKELPVTGSSSGISKAALLCQDLGKPKADGRHKGYEQQGDDHAQVKWQRRLHHPLHGHLGDGGADEEHGAHRRCQQSDAAV